MAQSTTNLGKIHVFPSETLYNQFKDIIADNDLALLKDDGAYIVAALLEQNGYVKFSNGLILQWGYASNSDITFPMAFSNKNYVLVITTQANLEESLYHWDSYYQSKTNSKCTFITKYPKYYIAIGQ